MAHPVRRNFAHLSAAERQAYIQAVLQADLRTYSDGVSYWDKQDQIHQGTHNHGDNSFVPWHRELVNRYERLLQESNPDVALHYWDWTEDPRAASDGQGGTVDLTDTGLFGTFTGMLNGALASVHNGGVFAGSREDTGNPADPPQSVERAAAAGAPGLASDASILAASNGVPQAQQWTAFWSALRTAHDNAHGYIGGDIGASHQAFEDPFVFLLHSNVDRLFAMWQTQPGQDWRLDPDQVYGDQGETTGDGGIRQHLQPWDGTVAFGSPIQPWVGASPTIEIKDCRHPSVVTPSCYDTLPLTVAQVSPAPADPIRFLDVVEHLPTARALRLRVRGCETVTAAASVTAPFTVLAATVSTPEPAGFLEQDLLVWVLYTPGAAGSSDSGTLTVTVAPTGDVFTVAITTTVVPNPSVGTSMVLDTSGSMSLPSGLPGKDRMVVLHDAAPLFVALLDADDGVGVVRFDTDATPVTPVVDAGPMIGGGGRLAALTAISATVTNPAGLTAIGDGLEAAAAQLAAVAGSYDSTATIVFTDGNETAEHTIAQAAASINSRVFAIGLGTADQLNPGALSDITNGTGGYLLLTGNPGVDDQLLLQKYFAQVLAGATNAVIVVDPPTVVPIGGKAVVPFELTDADIRADVLLLGEMARVVQAEIIAPDGTAITAGGGADEAIGDAFRALRVVPDAVAGPPVAGSWQLVLSIDDNELQAFFERLRKRLTRTERGGQLFKQAVTAIRTHGVPVTVSVQARSALRMGVDLSQTSRLPGSTGQLQVTLTDSGIPLAGTARVSAEITSPTGHTTTSALTETVPGIFTGPVPTTLSGVYRVLVRGRGADHHGMAFTREELRTVAVWAAGDTRPNVPGGPSDPGRFDVCGLLTCLLEHDGIQQLLKRHEIDPDEVTACIKRACR
jgi:hypothetical protein